MSRTTAKLILACMLLLCTVFLPRSSQATACCLNCLNTLDTCEANCHGNTTCNAGCVSRFNTCSRGCGPGGCGV
jgi:hypothetical protein